MKLILALPEHAEHIAAFYRANHASGFPHPELFEAHTVAQLLRDEEIAIVAASIDRRMAGCALGWPRAWNQSLEIGALSVDDVPGRGEIAKALFEAMRRYGLKRYGVVHFRAANESAFKRGREIGAMCWGFRPDPGLKTLAESELIMGFIEPDPDLPRVPPPKNLVTRTAFASRLNDGIVAEFDDVPYPKNFPVGSPRGTGTVVISGRIWPTYHSRGNYITIENSAGRFPVEIIREFVKKVRKKGVEDIRLTLPVNQDEAFKDLLGFGFQPVAYLPGWFIRGPHRFDCVEMVSGLPRASRHAASFVERAVSKIIDDLTPV